MKVRQLGLRLAAALSVAAALVGSTPTARAALLAYEPFNYTPGTGQWTDANALQSSTSLGGDFGWKEKWRSGGSGNDTNINALAGSLSYTAAGRTLVTAGNRWWVSGNASETGDNFSPGGPTNQSPAPYRRLNFAAQRGYTGASTTWISFLADLGTLVPNNFTGTAAGGGSIQYGRGVGAFQLFNNAPDNIPNDDPAMGNNGQGTEHLSFGRGTQDAETYNGGANDLGYANDTWAILNRGSAPLTVPSNVPLTTQVLVVMRINHAAGTNPAIGGQGDTAYFWLNPASLTNEPSTASGMSINPLSFTGPPLNSTDIDRDYIFNRIRIFGGNLSGTANIGYNSVIVDEFRIGETFADVTPNIPEPGSAALAAMALAALAIRRRK